MDLNSQFRFDSDLLPAPTARIPANHQVLSLLTRQNDALFEVMHDYRLRPLAEALQPLGEFNQDFSVTFETDQSQIKFPIDSLALGLNAAGSMDGVSRVDMGLALQCNPAISPEERRELLKTLEAFSPSETADNLIIIRANLRMVDTIRTVRQILEMTHADPGLERNMTLNRMAEEILRMPEPERRSIEIFRARIRSKIDELDIPQSKAPDFNLDSLKNLIRAQGKIALFEITDRPSEMFVETCADLLWDYLEVLNPKVDTSLDNIERMNALTGLADDFSESKDLNGLVGAAILVANGYLALDRFKAASEDIDPAYKMDPENVLQIAINAAELLNSFDQDPLSNLQAQNILMAIQDRLLRGLFDEMRGFPNLRGEPPEDLEIPKHIRNSLILDQEIIFEGGAGLPSSVSDLISDLFERDKSHEKMLVELAVREPELKERVLQIIENCEPDESSDVLAEKILSLTISQYKSAVVFDLPTAVDFLASRFARSHNLVNYNHEFGILPPKAKR